MGARVPSASLSKGERAQLQRISSRAEAHVYRSWAQLLLEWDRGRPLRELLSQVGLSRSWAYEVVQRFRARRLSIFPPEVIGSVQGGIAPQVELMGAPIEVPGVSTRPGLHEPEGVLPAVPCAVSPVTAQEHEEVPRVPGVLPDDPMAEAGRKLLRFHLSRMLEREPGTRTGEDVEALHDMRVATRRLRAAFQLFRQCFRGRAIRPYVDGLRRTGRMLGAVRDLDVLLDKAHRYLATLPLEQAHDLDPLLDAWKCQREEARAEMLSWLDSAEYRGFLEAFHLFLDTPGEGVRKASVPIPRPTLVRHVMPHLLYVRWARVLAFGPTVTGASPATLHALRIECKRLRYALEFFAEVLGRDARLLVAELVRLQDHLGDLHDADVANTLLSSFLFPSRGGATSVPVIAPGVVSYLAAKQRELQGLIAAFPDVWQRFGQAEVRRWLADAVAVL